MEPESLDDYISFIREAYGASEIAILEKLMKRLKEGLEFPYWEQQKLGELMAVHQDIFKNLPPALEDEVEKLLGKAYQEGMEQGGSILKRANLLSPEVNPATAKNSVRTLALATNNLLEGARLQIVRSAMDGFRQVITQTAATVLTGARTQKEAMQIALNGLAKRGLSGFIDRKGRKWNLTSYVDMALRATTHQASVQGHLDRFQAADRDLVRITNQHSACPKCAPFQGKVFSISGTSEQYPPLEEAKAGGLFHPGCRHQTGLYVPGLSPKRKPYDAEKTKENYKREQKLRNAERHIRQFKREQAMAMDDTAKQRAKTKTKRWQAKAREIVDSSNGELRRHYDRETIYK